MRGLSLKEEKELIKRLRIVLLSLKSQRKGKKCMNYKMVLGKITMKSFILITIQRYEKINHEKKLNLRRTKKNLNFSLIQAKVQ